MNTSATTNLTISINDTRTGTLISGFSWNFSTSNASDGNTKAGYCATTNCSLTNYTGTVNITVFNISGNTYFNASDSPKTSFIYNTSNLGYTFNSYSTSLTVNITNAVNGSTIQEFCLQWSNTSTSVTNCTTTGVMTFYLMTGNVTLFYFNITSNTYLNVTWNIGNYNSSSTTYTNTTSQALLSINATRLFLNTSISTFNITNYNLTNQTSSGTLLIRANNGTNNLRIDVGGNYSINYSCTASFFTTTACTIPNIYDSIIRLNATNSSTPVQNFNTTLQNTTLGAYYANTTSGPGILYPVLQGYAYYVTFQKTDLSDANATLLVQNNSYPYTFLVFAAPAVNFTFYDEINDSQITENMTLEIINDLASYNYTVQNGNRYINLTGLMGWTIFRYYNYEYAQRDYLLNMQPGGIYNLRLYDILLNDSQVVTATVYDTGNALIENATVSLLRYFVGCNCYRTVQMTSTGADGTGIFYVQALDGHYKWSVSYLGTVYYLSSTSEQINSNTRTFVIDLGSNFYTGFESLTTLGYTVTYNTTTNTLSYTFSDTSGIVSGGCLQVTYLSGVEYTTLQTTCTGGTSGGLLITLPNPNTTTYLYTASVNTTNTYTPTLTVNTGSIQAPSQYDFGNTGIFLAIGVLVVLVTIFSFSAVATILVTALGVIIISLLGIMTFTTTFVIGLCVLVLGISLFLMRS